MKPIAITATALTGVAATAGTALAIAATPPPAPVAGTAASGVHAAAKAARTAADAGNGRPYDLERDRHRGKRVWEVDVARASGRSAELLINADGSTVVRRGTTHRSDDADRARQAKTSLASAVRTAGRRAAGTLTEAEIDRKRGRLVWSVSFERRGTETEVDIEDRTGNVTSVRTEHDD
jgi:uncharacterized membrane protein YkoI